MADTQATQWTLIRRAQGRGPVARAALNELLRRYDRSIIAMIRHFGHPPDQSAEDLKQEFLTRFLEREDVMALDQSKGSFRAFLTTAVKNHLCNTWDSWRAQKNPARHTDYPAAFDVVSEDTVEHLVQQKFALDTLCHAQTQLREQSQNKERFDALRGALPTADIKLDDARTLAARLGMTPVAVRKAVFDLRKSFMRCLCRAVADTLQVDLETATGKAEVQRELGELYLSLSPSLDMRVLLLQRD
ncbi:MAG: RNA polymerase sigma factor [Myxococcota bacterium]